MALLHTQYYKFVDNIEMLLDTDKNIRKYIEENNTGQYNEIIKEDDRWEVFYHLSEMRSALLNWYEFKEGAEILEIGGEFGAITGTLCERNSHVTTVESSLFRAETISKRYSNRKNLDVYAGELEDISFEKKFDYIVLVGLLERQWAGSFQKDTYADYLHKILGLLKPDGKLLLAVENRYGIKYFCGAEDLHTGRAFAGINNYPNKTKGYSFSKQELTDIINMAGFPFHKFYYPLPDYKLPQLIYSENYLPEKNIGERLIPYYINKNTLIAYENDLYNDLVDNHVFEFFSNSFLVECSLDEEFCSTIYAAISIDRGKENGFLTTIHKDDIVRKRAIYNEGVKSTLKLYENMMDIKSHGLKIVPHKLEKNSVVMPYMKNITLSNYLKEIIKIDKDKFVNIFDRLYEYILSSSEHVSSEFNALCNDQTRELNWGIILKKAYIELIPLNSFYVDDEILFFDQEFVRNNYPAKYILFRALNYMYYFAPHVNDIISLDILKEKYELTELWNIFVAEENKFLASVRNHELYKQFYKWAAIDKNRMYNNAKVLAGNIESISEYQVTPKMKNIWAVQLDLLKAFIEVCEKNKLKYYIIYGTLLGAVRHKGFIPWDDDIDVTMPREDYEKLKKISANEFKEPYFFQMPENDADCFYNGYSRLRNSDTTGISVMDIGHDCNNGIWIDILPLDTCVSDQKKLKRKVKYINIFQKLIYAKVYGKDYEKFLNMSKFQWKLCCFVARLVKHNWLCRLLNTAITAYSKTDTEYVGIFTHYARYQVFDKSNFESSVELEFEDLELKAPIGYKRCLEMSLGRDYMKYPSLEERKPHHKGIFNTEYSYKKYRDLFFDIFRDCENKIIILFGAGLMFEDYMRKNSKKHTPAFLVDNDKGKWGTKRHEIEIRNPKEILKIQKEKRKVIICSVHYREIEKQLNNMGVEDYYIYIQEKEWMIEEE
ncbi:LicD family protein [Clostridium sp. BL-8]|uniref:LicD family protein n=1 Tax=Clostridium sp. BL-8 TaxID=349938 RepID=UPI00098C92D5|nr:LicD family protein [Clostridium sp. BL-8]OOM79956.1 LicD family protein [Clostridium sp. BL-8]